MKKATFADRYKAKQEAKQEASKESETSERLSLKGCWALGAVVAIIIGILVAMVSSPGVGILIGLPVGIAVACGASGINVNTDKRK